MAQHSNNTDKYQLLQKYGYNYDVKHRVWFNTTDKAIYTQEFIEDETSIISLNSSLSIESEYNPSNNWKWYSRNSLSNHVKTTILNAIGAETMSKQDEDVFSTSIQVNPIADLKNWIIMKKFDGGLAIQGEIYNDIRLKQGIRDGFGDGTKVTTSTVVAILLNPNNQTYYAQTKNSLYRLVNQDEI